MPAKPYYQDDAVLIYHADCRDILPAIPDGSIDLVLHCFHIRLLPRKRASRVGGGYFGPGAYQASAFVFHPPKIALWGSSYVK